MKISKLLVVLMTLTLISAVISIGSVQASQYSDVLYDDEGDVMHVHSTGYRYNVERPNIDILRAEVSESGGIVTISLTVKGIITSHTNISYYIYLGDDDGGLYMISYTNEYCQIWASNDQGWSMYEAGYSGVGTDTLVVTTTLEELLEPESLKLDVVYTYDYFTYGEYYWDTATANGDDGSGFVPEDYELHVSPTSGVAPLTVWIEAEAYNDGDVSGEVPVTIDGDVLDIVDFGPNEWSSVSFQYTFDESGTYTIVFGDQMVTVTVTDEPVEPDTPYSDLVTDPEGDVIRLVGPGEEDWTFVDSPDTDIRRVEISESGGVVSVSLRVKGTIRDDPDIEYELFLKDHSNGEYDIWYNDGDWEMYAYREYDRGAFGNRFKPVVSGVGTNTLTFSFSREQIGEPDVLLISWAAVYNEAYPEVDFAGPDAEYPPGYTDPIDDDNDNDTPPTDDNGDITPPDDDNGIPGFTLILLAISLIFAVLIYKKKR